MWAEAMGAVTTAFRVLEEVSQHQPVGVSELSRSLSLPKSTVQRALQSLQDVGWVEQESDVGRRWVQTTKLVVLASRGGRLGLRDRAMPVMRELSERTDENVHLSVRSGMGIAIVEKLESSKAVRPIDPLGIVVPFHASSSGKAILAWSDLEVVDEVLAHGLASFTKRTIVDGDELRHELKSIRCAGYAVNRGEWNDDVRSIAAPILDVDGRPRAAISVAAPAHRLPERKIPSIGQMVANAVSRLNLNRGHVDLEPEANSNT